MPTHAQPAPEPSRLARRRLPVQERGRKRVERLLEAAESLLGDHPADEVTASAIAERAGVPIGSLYQYFPNALAVLAELMQRRLEALDAQTIAAIESSYALPWDEAVDRIVEMVLTNFSEHERDRTTQVLVRTVVLSPEFRLQGAASSARVARALAAHPKLVAALPDPEKRWCVARTTIEAATGIQGWAIDPSADDHTVKLPAIADEMKTLVKAYLGRYLENAP